jgi:monoterpene epsilon-lactone hydrolase
MADASVTVPVAGGPRLANPPDALELRHLRAFICVAEELNFSRAADRLFVSQPALSRQIRALERLIGCDLLRRSTHQVELTPGGEALLEPARQLLRDLAAAVGAARSASGELAATLHKQWGTITDLTAADAALRELRGAYEALHAQFALPQGLTVLPVNANGVACLRLAPETEPPATVVYLHGGCYSAGSAFGYRHLAGALAVAADRSVLVPEYRLAPEHAFPAAVEDAVRSYLWLLDQDIPPSAVTIVGDSSGAHLALSLLLVARREDLPLPGRVVLFSPWLDMSCPYPDPEPGDPQPVVTPERARRFAASYLAGHPADDPVVSPLTADLSGLPLMLIQAGTGDPLLQEARWLADRARAHGAEVRLDLYPVDTHVFHTFWTLLPEAADALRVAGRFTAGRPA